MFLDVNSCWNNIWDLWWIRSSHNNGKEHFPMRYTWSYTSVLRSCRISTSKTILNNILLGIHRQNSPSLQSSWKHTHTHTVTTFLRGKNTPDLPLNPLPSSFTSDLSKHQSHRHHELFWRELKGDAIGPFHTVKSFCHQQIWSALSFILPVYKSSKPFFYSQLNSILSLPCSSGEKRI